MLRKLFIALVILGTATMIFAFVPQDKEVDNALPEKMGATVKEIKENGKKITVDPDHKLKSINCKSCHYCEYPTANDPCLIICPRNEMISVYHKPEEGPEIVIMEDLPGEWGAVAFTHKLHAEMAEMSGGCSSCHHYNTTGPVLKCKSCHEEKRLREDISIPDLEAAYHRQCINCHRQWSRTTECQYCHFEKGIDADKARKIKMEQYAGKGHPDVLEPERVLYETEYDHGKFVTFFHDEHTDIFNIECATCHHDENCMKCHDVRAAKLRTKEDRTYQKKIHKSFEEHHQACISCHEDESCNKCHLDHEMQRFDHKSSTGFALSEFHSDLACSRCHEGGKFNETPSSDCLNCHKTTFKSGVFDHNKTGFELDILHVDFSCNDCHKNNKYEIAPTCDDCHDGKNVPDDLPGEYLK